LIPFIFTFNLAVSATEGTVLANQK